MLYQLKYYSMILTVTGLSYAQVTIIHCGTLIDGNSKKASKVVSVLIEDGIIIDVSEGYVDPDEGDIVIDLNSFTVLPGLMDMHTHLSGESNPKRYMERFTMDLDDYAFRSIQYAEKTLLAGFTTCLLYTSPSPRD